MSPFRAGSAPCCRTLGSHFPPLCPCGCVAPRCSLQLAEVATGDAGIDESMGGVGGAGGAGSAAPVAAATAASAAKGAPAAGSPAYRVRFGGVTDPGVAGKVNQDAFTIWEKGDGLNFVFGVFDGHGRELGQLAGATARDSLTEFLGNDEAFARLRSNPKETLDAAFQHVHDAIQAAFRKFYTENGWTVTEAAEGYLLRRRHESQAWMCVHGGTTGTVVVIIDGRRMVVANVGDSTAILCGTGEQALMRDISTWDSDVSAGATLSDVPGTEWKRSAVVQLSQDHSPESESEFKRMREFRPCPHRANHPELLFVYDTLSASKLSCPPIFVVGSDGSCTATNRGAYYKNVRNEWATLVAVPPYARYQDALAFTRSLGDFHLQTYGVSHTPEVFWMDIGTKEKAEASAASAATPPPVFCMVLCSDGVWDNWKFEEVAEYVLDESRVAAVTAGKDRDAFASDLMDVNKERARRNFGNQADNMTAISAYLLPAS